MWRKYDSKLCITLALFRTTKNHQHNLRAWWYTDLCHRNITNLKLTKTGVLHCVWGLYLRTYRGFFNTQTCVGGATSTYPISYSINTCYVNSPIRKVVCISSCHIFHWNETVREIMNMIVVSFTIGLKVLR